MATSIFSALIDGTSRLPRWPDKALLRYNAPCLSPPVSVTIKTCPADLDPCGDYRLGRSSYPFAWFETHRGTFTQPCFDVLGLLTLYSFLRDPASLDSVCSPEDWSDLAISGATRFSRLAILVIDCFEIPNGHPQSRNPYTALIQISASWSCRSESPVSQTKTKNDSFMLPRPRRMSLLLPEIPLYQW